jgi:ATPase family associated with various cellular activities (AAA)
MKSQALSNDHPKPPSFGYAPDVLLVLAAVRDLVSAAVMRARTVYGSTDSNRHLAILDQEVSILLSDLYEYPSSVDAQMHDVVEHFHSAIEAAVNSSHVGDLSMVGRLQQVFQLDLDALGFLFICAAPQIDSRFRRLYGFLADDLTRCHASLALAQVLLGPSAVCSLRRALDTSGCLGRWQLLHAQRQNDDHALTSALTLDETVLGVLLGHRGFMPPLRECCTLETTTNDWPLIIDDAAQRSLSQLSTSIRDGRRLLLCCSGPEGSGRRTLARHLGQTCKIPVVKLNLSVVAEDRQHETCMVVARWAALTHAMILTEALTNEGPWQRAIETLSKFVPYLTVVMSHSLTPEFHDQAHRHIHIHLRPTTVPLREQAWKLAFQDYFPQQESSIINELASAFRFTPGRIRRIAAEAHEAQVLSTENTRDLLFATCRRYSQRAIGGNVRRIVTGLTWDDLVLAPRNLAALKSLCGYYRHRSTVLDKWGFAEKLPYGRGIATLFHGTSGTGKTMTASVLANDLGLDLYRVELASVVSKYIGETEKNLERVFDEVEQANGMLFFDEADALFGKRTEVRSSNDRYANLESGYLLQRLENFPGVVVLATNLRSNIDDAFCRRLRCIIEFPFPDQTMRQRLWRSMFPQSAPVAPDIDFVFLAERLPLAGGAIKNAVLAAASRAAEENHVISMTHLLDAGREELEKSGKPLFRGELAPMPKEADYASHR